MAQRIAVNTSVLKRDTNEIDESIEKLKSISKAVYDDVGELNGMWEGAAHAALVFQFVQDYEFVKSTIIWLKNYKEELENAQKEYDKAEHDISSLIQQLK